MSMMNTGDILETIEMFTQDNLDVRTVTMGKIGRASCRERVSG